MNGEWNVHQRHLGYECCAKCTPRKRSGRFWGAMAMGLNAAASGNSANGDYGSALRADLNMNMMQNMQWIKPWVH